MPMLVPSVYLDAIDARVIVVDRMLTSCHWCYLSSCPRSSAEGQGCLSETIQLITSSTLKPWNKLMNVVVSWTWCSDHAAPHAVFPRKRSSLICVWMIVYRVPKRHVRGDCSRQSIVARMWLYYYTDTSSKADGQNHASVGLLTGKGEQLILCKILILHLRDSSRTNSFQYLLTVKGFCYVLYEVYLVTPFT